MATTYNNLAQAQAAYDAVLKQKQGVLRADEVRRNRALLGVDNYLKQQGINGGHAESIKLKANGMRSDTTDFDNQLINLAAIIQGFNSSRGRGGTLPKPTDRPAPLGSGAYASIPSDVYYQMFQKGTNFANPYIKTVQNGRNTYDSRYDSRAQGVAASRLSANTLDRMLDRILK